MSQSPVGERWASASTAKLALLGQWAGISIGIAVIFSACRVEHPSPATPLPAPASEPVTKPEPLTNPEVAVAPRQSAPLMVWGGSSYIGFLRVELWAGQSPEHHNLQELQVTSTRSPVRRYSGHMVSIPSDLLADRDRGQWSAFVLSTEDIEKSRGVVPAMLAAVSPAGVLRLYEFSNGDGIGAIDLPPLK